MSMHSSHWYFDREIAFIYKFHSIIFVQPDYKTIVNKYLYTTSYLLISSSLWYLSYLLHFCSFLSVCCLYFYLSASLSAFFSILFTPTSEFCSPSFYPWVCLFPVLSLSFIGIYSPIIKYNCILLKFEYEMSFNSNQYRFFTIHFKRVPVQI